MADDNTDDDNTDDDLTNLQVVHEWITDEEGGGVLSPGFEN